MAEPVLVPETLAGERVDRAVALLTGWSRSAVREMVERGDVLVDGVPVARSARLQPGSTLVWTNPASSIIALNRAMSGKRRIDSIK